MATQGQPRPVIRGKMGEEGSEITYYVLKMSISELVRDVLLTTEISTYDNKTLSDSLQRNQDLKKIFLDIWQKLINMVKDLWEALF